MQDNEETYSQQFRSLVERDLHGEATPEECAYLCSTREILTQWDSTLVQLAREADAHLGTLKQRLEKEQPQYAALGPVYTPAWLARKAELDKKRAGTLHFREFVQARRVYVKGVRAALIAMPKLVTHEAEMSKRSKVGKGYRMALTDLAMLAQRYGLPIEETLALMTDYSEQVMRVWEEDEHASNNSHASFMAFVGVWLRDRRPS